MSGVVSGLGKIFATVGSGIARVSQAITGVAGSVFASGAATGSFAGAAQQFGQTALGRILTGAAKLAGIGGDASGGLMTAAGLGGPQGMSGNFPPAPSVPGIATANTPSGVAPTGSTGPSASSPAGGSLAASGAMVRSPALDASAASPTGNGFGQFLNSETGGRLISGLGSGLGQYMKARQEEQEAEKDRQFLRDKQQAITDGYNIDPSVLHGPVKDDVSRPKPSDKYARMRFNYDPQRGMVVAG